MIFLFQICIGSDQNILKRKIKEALKSTEGKTIIESMTSSGSPDANRVKTYFYEGVEISVSKIDTWISSNFEKIFNYLK